MGLEGLHDSYMYFTSLYTALYIHFLCVSQSFNQCYFLHFCSEFSLGDFQNNGDWIEHYNLKYCVMSHFQDFDLEVTSIFLRSVWWSSVKYDLGLSVKPHIGYVEFTSFKNSIGFSASHIWIYHRQLLQNLNYYNLQHDEFLSWCL